MLEGLVSGLEDGLLHALIKDSQAALHALCRTEMNGDLLPLLHAWLSMLCKKYGTCAHLFLMRPSIKGKKHKNYICLDKCNHVGSQLSFQQGIERISN